MTFSLKVKTELCKNLSDQPCCRRAFLYGMLLFGRSFTAKCIELKTENEAIAVLYEQLLHEVCGVKVQVQMSQKGKVTVTVEEQDRLTVLTSFGHSEKEVTLKINHSNFECDECEGAFFAGAFLSCGTISAPNKDYHLEFVVPFLNLSRSLMKLMSGFDLQPKLTNRKGYSIVYYKESESIEECLYRMGAHSCVFELMNIKVVKDFRNKANRVSNCENANISRMVNAAAPQMKAIEKIQQANRWSELSKELAEIATLRIDYPEASLQELALLTSEGLSRSGVNHRLKKIEKFAQEIS